MADIKIKHRPKKFKTFLGNYETVDTLKTLIDSGDLPNSILLTGPRGCGKTTLGRIIRRELGCSKYDYKELDSAIFNGIDTVRALRNELIYTPKKGDVKVYLIDEVHMLGQGGASAKNKPQNALLKSLEEPPDFVYFILCTTNPEMLISTIRSRCTDFMVNPLNKLDGTKLVKRVSKKEGKEIPPKVMQRIYKVCQGFPRDTLSMLAKVMHLKTERKMLKMIRSENLEENGAIIDLCRILMKGGKWIEIAKILKSLKAKPPEDLRRGIMGYANSVLLNGNPEGNLILGWFVYRATYDAGMPMITQFCYNIHKRIEPPC